MARTMKMRSLLRRFSRRSDGGVTTEFVMWLPIFTGLLLLTVDASLLFMTQSNYWSVSRDTARLVARHAMDETAAKAYAEARAGNANVSPTATVTINGSTVTVNLSAPARSIAAFNALGLTTGVMIDASVSQTLEPI